MALPAQLVCTTFTIPLERGRGKQNSVPRTKKLTLGTVIFFAKSQLKISVTQQILVVLYSSNHYFYDDVLCGQFPSGWLTESQEAKEIQRF